MFRDRTNLYISYRSTVPRHSISLGSPRQTRRSRFETAPEEEERLIGETENAIEMTTLPPVWVDMEDEVNDILADIAENTNRLDSLHQRNLLPGFDDRSADEAKIYALTADITAKLHQAQNIIKRLDQVTKTTTTPADTALASNMKTALAGKVQEASTKFRKMQSLYAKSLRKDEPVEPKSYNPAEEDYDEISRDMLQSSQQVTAGDSRLLQREREINAIAQGIMEVSEIFRDMQNMVIDQGTLLDRIDYNIETVKTEVKGADRELKKASHYQTRSQKCKVIFLLSLIVFGLFLVLLLKPHRSSAPKPATPEVPQDAGR